MTRHGGNARVSGSTCNSSPKFPTKNYRADAPSWSACRNQKPEFNNPDYELRVPQCCQSFGGLLADPGLRMVQEALDPLASFVRLEFAKSNDGLACNLIVGEQLDQHGDRLVRF